MDSNQPAKDETPLGSLPPLDPGPSRFHSRWGMLLAAGMIVAAGLATYANSFWGPFIYDDFFCILDNPSIRQLWPLSGPLSPPCTGGSVTSRPLLNLSLAVNYRWGGLDVWGYHATNLAIHLIGGLLLLGIVRRTFLLPVLQPRYGEAAWGLALVIALLWTVHPLQTESVTYIIQRAESLAGLFYLLVLYSVIRGSQSSHRGWWYTVAMGACFLGVAVKEPIVTAPVVVLLYDYTFLEDSFRKILRRRWGLYAGLFASWGLLVYLQAKTGLPVLEEQLGPIGFWGYMRSEPGVILYYLRLSLWPHPLCFSYEWPVADSLGAILPGALMVGLLGAMTVWGLWKRRGWGFLGAWFFLILAPTSSVMPLRQLAFEHRMYLSLAAVVALVVAGGYVVGQRLLCWGWMSRRTGLVTGMSLAVAMAGMMGYRTFQRNKVYQSESSVWRDTVAKVPSNYSAYNSLGVSLARTGHLSEAIEQYQESIRLKPDYALPHNNLGTAMLALGRPAEAAEHCKAALRVDPASVGAHNNLGSAMLALGRPAEAIEHFQRALQLQSGQVTASYNLADALAQAGRLTESSEQYREFLRAEPDDAEAHNNWGNVLLRLERVPEAIAQFDEAVRLKPDYASAHYNLCLVLARTGRLTEAVGHGREAVRLQPKAVQSNRLLAWLMATQESSAGGTPKEAVEAAERACDLTGRRDALCLDTLSAAYASAGRFDEAAATAKVAWQLAQSAGDSSLAEEIHIRLQLYRDRKPYREPVGEAKGRP